MTDKEILKCGLSDIKMSSEPNKMVIEGCIAKIGEPSTGAPCGADGKKVVFTEDAVKQCGGSFVGMPLNCTFPDDMWGGYGSEVFTGHGDTNIGYIRKIKSVDNNLMAELVVWKEKFPEEAFMIVNGMDALGFSVEWYATSYHDEGEIRYMEEFQGIGCALLWKNVAAFSETFISKLAASKQKQDRSDTMTEQEKKEIIDAVVSAMTDKVAEKVSEISASVDKIAETIEAQGKANEEIKAALEAQGKALEDSKVEFQSSLDKAIEAMAQKAEASQDDADVADEKSADVEPIEAAAEEKVIPVPTATQSVVPNPVVSAADEKADKIAKIQASSMTSIEKLREITKVRFAQ